MRTNNKELLRQAALNMVNGFIDRQILIKEHETRIANLENELVSEKRYLDKLVGIDFEHLEDFIDLINMTDLKTAVTAKHEYFELCKNLRIGYSGDASRKRAARRFYDNLRARLDKEESDKPLPIKSLNVPAEWEEID